jgi:hypothetical protein
MCNVIILGLIMMSSIILNATMLSLIMLNVAILMLQCQNFFLTSGMNVAHFVANMVAVLTGEERLQHLDHLPTLRARRHRRGLKQMKRRSMANSKSGAQTSGIIYDCHLQSS